MVATSVGLSPTKERLPRHRIDGGDVGEHQNAFGGERVEIRAALEMGQEEGGGGGGGAFSFHTVMETKKKGRRRPGRRYDRVVCRESSCKPVRG